MADPLEEDDSVDRPVTPGKTARPRRRGQGGGPPPGGADPAKAVLGRIRVVLVEPTGPRNIGATARAMKNFGLSRLVLVNPPPLDHPECLEMSVNAHDVLHGARIVGSVAEAIADAGLVVATTARPRHRLSTQTPAEAAPAILAAAAAEEVAILFGTERTGLTDEQMGVAQLVLSARTADEHAALNLGQAVLLVAHELFEASGVRGVTAEGQVGRLLDFASRQLLLDELVLALEKMKVLKAENRGPYRESLRRILAAGPLQTRDARVLFALARHAQSLADPQDPGTRPPRPPRPRR